MPARGERGLEETIAELLDRVFREAKEGPQPNPYADCTMLGHGDDYVIVRWCGELLRVDAMRL